MFSNHALGRSVWRGAPALLAVAVSLAFSPAAGASDTTLATTLHKWSRTIGSDAHAVAVAAQQRHPRHMSTTAVRFHKDALRARTAIAAQHTSSAKGRQARTLSLRAYSDYAKAGSLWAASGRARANGHKPAATRLAHNAATTALAGNRLLTTAATLLP